MTGKKKPLKVLIIEDCAEDRETYKRYLMGSVEYDFTFLESSTVDKGLDLSRQERPDCLLLDYNLPDGSGLGFLAEIGDTDAALIMLTGQGSERIAVEAMKKGADDYLIKGSITPALLEHSIRGAIEKKALYRTIRVQQQALERRATIDDLTGLPNRYAFLEHAKREVLRSKRFGSLLCLLMLDLDHFKQINDDHGHDVGDRTLAATGQVIAKTIRASDLCGRYGGEEFLILLVETDIDKAKISADRLRTAIGKIEITVSGTKPVQVTCSIGIAEFVKDIHDLEQLIKNADEALYAAKTAGRDCLKIYRSKTA